MRRRSGEAAGLYGGAGDTAAAPAHVRDTGSEDDESLLSRIEALERAVAELQRRLQSYAGTDPDQ